MKTIILFRHAKSEPQSLIKSDFERHINPIGVDRTRLVARKLADLKLNPDIILCSTAARTRETLDICLDTTRWMAPVEFIENLYHASASEILNMIERHGGDKPCVLVVGHNFGISNLADTLSESGAELMPTSGVHVLTFDSEIEPHKGRLIHSIRPKQL